MFTRRYKLRSKKYLREKRKRLFKKIWKHASVVILFLILFALISHLEQFKIENIIIEGNSVLRTDAIEKVIKEELRGGYLGIFAKDNSLIFPKDAIRDNVEKEFERIGDVKISFLNLHSIKVVVKERESVAVWCEGDIGEDSDNCYFLDDDGYIFSQSPTFSGNIFFKYYGGGVDGFPVDSNYLSKDKFKEINFFLMSLKDIGLNPVAYEWGSLPDNDSKLLLMPTKNIGIDAILLFNNQDDLGKIYKNLESILADDTFVQSKKKIIHLEYIDMRFGNKILYKPK